MTDCTRCIMEHSDGIILLDATIYIIEGDFYAGKAEAIAVEEDVHTGQLRPVYNDENYPF